jgi:hypothetical protein
MSIIIHLEVININVGNVNFPISQTTFGDYCFRSFLIIIIFIFYFFFNIIIIIIIIIIILFLSFRGLSNFMSIIIHLEVININVGNVNFPIGFYSNPQPL